MDPAKGFLSKPFASKPTKSFSRSGGYSLLVTRNSVVHDSSAAPTVLPNERGRAQWLGAASILSLIATRSTRNYSLLTIRSLTEPTTNSTAEYR